MASNSIELDLKLTSASEKLLKELEDLEGKTTKATIDLQFKNYDKLQSINKLDGATIKPTIDIQFKNFDKLQSINALIDKTINTTVNLEVKGLDKLDGLKDIASSIEDAFQKLSKLDLSNLTSALSNVSTQISEIRSLTGTFDEISKFNQSVPLDRVKNQLLAHNIEQRTGTSQSAIDSYRSKISKIDSQLALQPQGPYSDINENTRQREAQEKAIQDYQRRISLSTNPQGPSSSLSDHQKELENQEKAIQAYRKKVGIIPQGPSSKTGGLTEAREKFDALGLFQQKGQKSTIAQDFGLADESLLKDKTITGFLKDKFLGNGGSGLATVAEAIAGGTKGVTGLVGSGVGEFLGGPVGAAIGGTLLPAVVERFQEAFDKVAESLGKAINAAVQFQQSVVSLSGILQANTNVTSPSGRPLSIREQVATQNENAEKLLLKSRSKLLPLGIAGQQEAILVQAIASGAAQKGIILSDDEVATLAERFGSTILAQRPELLNNPQRLRVDVEDVLAGSGSASRTVLGSLVRPNLGPINRSATGDDLLGATSNLTGFTDAIKNSNLLSVQLQRLSGFADNATLNLGLVIAKFTGITEVTKGLADALQTVITAFDSAAAGIEEVKDNIRNALPKPVGDAIFGEQKTTEVKPEVEIRSLLRKVGISNEDVSQEAINVDFSPENVIKRLTQLQSSFGTKAEFDPALANVVSRGIIDSNAKILSRKLGGLDTGFAEDRTFASKLTIASNNKDIEALENKRKVLESQLGRQKSGGRGLIQNKEFLEENDNNIKDIKFDLAADDFAKNPIANFFLQNNPLLRGLGLGTFGMSAEERKGKEDELAGKESLAKGFQFDADKVNQIQQQIVKNEQEINAKRAANTKEMQNQVGLARELADLQTATIANLGPADGSNVRSASSKMAGILSEMEEQKKLLTGNKANDAKTQLRIDGTKARFKESVQQLNVAGIDQRLANTNTLTLAGRREAGFLGIQREIKGGAISAEIGKAKTESFDETNKLSSLQETTSLAKSVNDANLAIETAPLRFEELENALKKANFALEDFARNVELANASDEEKVVEAIRKAESSGSGINSDQLLKLNTKYGYDKAAQLVDEARGGEGFSFTKETREKLKADRGLDQTLVNVSKERTDVRDSSALNQARLNQTSAENNVKNFGNTLVSDKIQQTSNLQKLNELFGGQKDNPFKAAFETSAKELSGFFDEKGNVRADALNPGFKPNTLAQGTPGAFTFDPTKAASGKDSEMSKLNEKLTALVTSLDKLVAALAPSKLSESIGTAISKQFQVGN